MTNTEWTMQLGKAGSYSLKFTRFAKDGAVFVQAGSYWGKWKIDNGRVSEIRIRNFPALSLKDRLVHDDVTYTVLNLVKGDDELIVTV